MRNPDPNADPEDIFKDTRMSFGDHIEELRSHMLRAIYGFVIGMVVALIFAKWVFAIITDPVQDQLMEFYNRRVEKVTEQLKSGNKQFEKLDQPKEMPYLMTRADAEKIGLKTDQMDTEGDMVKVPL